MFFFLERKMAFFFWSILEGEGEALDGFPNWRVFGEFPKKLLLKDC